MIAFNASLRNGQFFACVRFLHMRITLHQISYLLPPLPGLHSALCFSNPGVLRCARLPGSFPVLHNTRRCLLGLTLLPPPPLSPCVWVGHWLMIPESRREDVREKKESDTELPWQSSGLDSTLPLQGVRVPTLVGELRSHFSQSRTKKIFKKKAIPG